LPPPKAAAGRPYGCSGSLTQSAMTEHAHGLIRATSGFGQKSSSGLVQTMRLAIGNRAAGLRP
jgi:hypothetical protein